MVIRHPTSEWRAFTLVELLAVIVIISIVAALTMSAYRSIASDARISMASNAVGAVLDNARAMAIQKHRRVLVAFRPILVGSGKQQVEMTIAVESNDMHVNENAAWEWNAPQEPMLGLRFTPVDGIEPRLLPEGMLVASPVYSMNSRDTGPISSDAWLSLSYLPAMQGGPSQEAPGVILGIIFDKTGTVRTSFSNTGAQLAFIDYNGDGGMRCGLNPGTQQPNDFCLSPCNTQESGPMLEGVPVPEVDYDCVFGFGDEDSDGYDDVMLNYCHGYASEEPYLLIAPHFAIYDYDEARELYPPEDPLHDWSDPFKRRVDLDKHVRLNGTVFHFNRYTGMISK